MIIRLVKKTMNCNEPDIWFRTWTQDFSRKTWDLLVKCDYGGQDMTLSNLLQIALQRPKFRAIASGSG